MSVIARICPVCNGVRGLKGSERRREHLCLSSDDCLEALLKEISLQPKEPGHD
jgi:hypothetical protein